VPADNSNEMAGAIIRLIENEELRHTLAENGYQFAQNSLSFEQMMGKTIKLYRNYFRFPNVRSKSGIEY
jgi:glycosyltransferase involved in cell wall biosynthesis